MARRTRIEFPGAIYHVFNRGNYRKPLFGDPGANTAFIGALFEAAEFSNWLIHAYALMPNHYHFLLETPDANLSKGMQWLQGTFAMRFNRYHKEMGHVFQGRFKAPLVEPGTSLRRVADYIHLNPVKAGLVSLDQLKNYRYSSYRHFWGNERHPRLIRGEFLKSLNLPDTEDGMKAYEKWLESRDYKIEQEREELESDTIIGSETYSKKFEESDWPENPDKSESPEEQWKRLLANELARMGKSEADIEASPKLASWKIDISRLLQKRTQATGAWIAKELKMGHPSNVSRYRNGLSECTKPKV